MLAVAGCSKAPADTGAEVPNAPVEAGGHRLVAVVSCMMGGGSTATSTCLVADNDGIGGSLKVQSGGTVKAYSQDELSVDFANPDTEIPLQEPYSIAAQANGMGGVLRVVIKDGANTVFQDETTKFGVISTTSGQ